jgi:putative transposase
MANTFASLHVHLVFSTKNRKRWLTANVEEQIWRYLGGICRAHHIKALQIGGFDDHVHLLLGHPPTITLSDLVRRLKGESSKWISDTFSDMATFAWQDGYGIFSVGQSQIPATIRYIQEQREHHAQMPFEAEYQKFLHKHSLQADEQYVFG